MSLRKLNLVDKWQSCKFKKNMSVVDDKILFQKMSVPLPIGFLGFIHSTGNSK